MVGMNAPIVTENFAEAIWMPTTSILKAMVVSEAVTICSYYVSTVIEASETACKTLQVI